MSADSAGSSRTTRSTMPPIGSSTSGIQSSSSWGTGEVWPFSRAPILGHVAALSDLLLERLAAEPDRAGLFLDFDGVLAPIVERPEDAAPPPETRAELERLVARYALVAVVSGRAGDDVRGRLGVEGVVCVGSHGLELEPRADRWRRMLAAFVAAGRYRAEGGRGGLSLPGPGRRASGGARARRDRRSRHVPGADGALRAQGARGSPAGRLEQGDGGAETARGTRTAAGPGGGG